MEAAPRIPCSICTTLSCKSQRGPSSRRACSRNTESAPPDTATPTRSPRSNMRRCVTKLATWSSIPSNGGSAGRCPATASTDQIDGGAQLEKGIIGGVDSIYTRDWIEDGVLLFLGVVGNRGGE